MLFEQVKPVIKRFMAFAGWVRARYPD